MNNSKSPVTEKCRLIDGPGRKDRPPHPMEAHTQDSGFGFPDRASSGPGDRHPYALKCTYMHMHSKIGIGTIAILYLMG